MLLLSRKFLDTICSLRSVCVVSYKIYEITCSPEYYFNDKDVKYDGFHVRGNIIYGYKKTTPITDRGYRTISPDDKGLIAFNFSKFARMFYPFKDEEITLFAGNIKKFVLTQGDEFGEGKDTFTFSIASGDMIPYYYHNKNYAIGSGNLNNSCMRDDKYSAAFNIYARNSCVSMLVMRNSTMTITARALLWHKDGTTYMDTVYSVDEQNRDIMIDYAIANGFYYKSSQSCHWHAFDMLGGKKIKPVPVIIELDEFDALWEFPYLDSMFFVSKTIDNKFYIGNVPLVNCKEYYKLRNTNMGVAMKGSRQYESMIRRSALFYTKIWYAAYNNDRFLRSPKISIRDSYFLCYGFENYREFIEQTSTSASTINDALCKRSDYVFVSGGYLEYTYNCVMTTAGKNANKWFQKSLTITIGDDIYYKDDKSIVKLSPIIYKADAYWLKDDAVMDWYSDKWIKKEDAVYVEHLGNTYKNTTRINLVQINGKYYDESTLKKSFVTGKLHHTSELYQVAGYNYCTKEEYEVIKYLDEEAIRTYNKIKNKRQLASQVKKLLKNPELLEQAKQAYIESKKQHKANDYNLSQIAFAC